VSCEEGLLSDAEVTHSGQVHRYAAADARRHVHGSGSFHSRGDPSTWLCSSIFYDIRGRFPSLPLALQLDLAGQSLGIAPEKVRHGVEWAENYSRMRDGEPTDFRLE
jgi:hypothetical protein